MIDPVLFRWDTSIPSLRLVRHIKGDPGSGRQIDQVTDGSKNYALKVHKLGSTRKRWRARQGESRLKNELTMARAALERGLPVPTPISIGQETRLGLVVKEALLSMWVEGKQSLRDLIVARVESNDKEGARRFIEVFIAMAGRVRAAGLADSDFASGQLLVDPGAADMNPTWLDLEAAFLSEPADPAGTAATVGMAMANVWNLSRCDEKTLAFAWDLVRQTVSTPTGGWAGATHEIEKSMRQGVAKAIRRGRHSTMPPPLR